MTTFSLNTKLINACIPAMSKEQIRYYLCGVHIFERDGKLIYEATNGHMLIRVTDNEYPADREVPKGLNVILEASDVKLFSKNAKAKNKYMTNWDATVNGSVVTIGGESVIASVAIVDGTFPDCDLVIPTYTDEPREYSEIGWNLSYLSILADSLKAMGKTSPHANFNLPNDNRSPGKFTQDNWLGILMPVRI